MDVLRLWALDHAGLLLAATVALCVAFTAGAALRLARSSLRRERGARGFTAAAGAGAWLVAAAAGLVLSGHLLILLGPELLAQERLVGEADPRLLYYRLGDGSVGRLSDFRGKVVLVNHWASTCPPCREELADLDRLQRLYGDRGLVVLHLSAEPQDALAEFLAANPAAAEHGRIRPLPWPDLGLPTSFVVDRVGVVHKVLRGGRGFAAFERAVLPLL